MGYLALFDVLKAPLQLEDLLDIGPVQIVIQAATCAQNPFLDTPMSFVQRGG